MCNPEESGARSQDWAVLNGRKLYLGNNLNLSRKGFRKTAGLGVHHTGEKNATNTKCPGKNVAIVKKRNRNFRIGYPGKKATNTTMPARTWQPQYRICCLSSGDVIQKLQQSGRPRGDVLALDAYMHTCMHVIVPYAGHSSA
jgi:hypothetical protein